MQIDKTARLAMSAFDAEIDDDAVAKLTEFKAWADRIHANDLARQPGKKIGYKRIIFAGRSSAKDLKLPPCDAVRLCIDNSLACPLIHNFQIVGTES